MLIFSFKINISSSIFFDEVLIIAVKEIKKIRKCYDYNIFHNFFDKFSISKSFENFLRKSFQN